MTNPGTFADNAVHTFTAPANTTLSASTTYWVVTSNSAALGGTGFRVGVVPFTTLDSGAAAGWSIGAARLKNYIAAPSWNHSTRRIRFEIRGTNPPTVATAIPDQSATAGTAFSYVFPANTFSDADTSDTLTYTATKADDTALPTWLSFAAGTRTFSGTPQAADAGTVAVKVTASDGNGGSVSDAFDITVIISVPSNWTLKPTALAAGAKFRLLFLSSTTSAVSSTDIADYNTFIQTRAAAGHTDIRAYSAGFRVVGCTAAVDARDNTKTTYTTTDKGVPIYWLNGAKAADQYEDFYDGSWDDEANDKNESGTNGPDTSQAGNWPLTGCSHDGTEQWPLGASQVSVGRPNSSGSGHGPLFANAQITSGVSSLLYGLSGVFQVAAAVVVPNNPPAFSADTAARSVAENTAAGQNVGAALTATDADSDTLTYTLEGTDAASFDIVSGSGQIRTRTGVTYNHEAKSTHTVVVKADDGNGGTDTVTVTITVTDVDEPPGQPAAPTVSATAGSTTSLDVTWTAPTNTGPAIASYDLQYRAGTSGNFTNGPQNVTGTSAAIGSLAADTSYEVQVRATNAEGDGDWSVAGTGRTTATSAPGAPTGLTATASGTTAINLSWSAPGSNGGSAITGYRIEVSSNGTSSWTNLVANTSNTTTTYAHTGLTAGATRHYRVSAINANGTGVPSNVANATTGATAPGAPTGLTATASGDHRDQPLLERPGQHRRLRHHRLQDRGLLQRRLQLDQPRCQHEQRQHDLRAHRADRRHHAPLPRVRHQHQRRRHRLQRRQRHHGPDDGHVRSLLVHRRGGRRHGDGGGAAERGGIGDGDDPADEDAPGRRHGGGLLGRAVERDVHGRANAAHVHGDGDRRRGQGRRRERAARVRDAAGRVRAGRPPHGDGDAGRRRCEPDRELRHGAPHHRQGARERHRVASVHFFPEHQPVRAAERQSAAAGDDPAGGDAPGRGDTGGLRGEGAADADERDVRGGRERDVLLYARETGPQERDRRGPAAGLRPAAGGGAQGHLGAVRNDRVRGPGSARVHGVVRGRGVHGHGGRRPRAGVDPSERAGGYRAARCAAGGDARGRDGGGLHGHPEERAVRGGRADADDHGEGKPTIRTTTTTRA